MKLAIFNGSPRNKKSNSKILTDHFLSGYSRICSDPVSVHYLASGRFKEEGKELFQNAEIVILIFPLYTDCMPGIVKEFIESIAELELKPTKKIGYIVQSGFPEAIHSVNLERYLEKLTKRLKCKYLGTVIKGGVEGIQVMPGWMTKKLYANFRELGEYFAKTMTFSPKIKGALRKPYKMSATKRFIFNVVSSTGLTNFYWDSNLKKNGVFEDRFAKPYESEI